MKSFRVTTAALVIACAVFVSTFFAPRSAHAYAWMIRHSYTNCATCHADPSGGGLLTEYGRAQGEILLRTPFGRTADDDPGKAGDFLFGAFKVPENLLLGGDVRGLILVRAPTGTPVKLDAFLMQADVQAQYTIKRFRMNASVGFAKRGAEGARITGGDNNNLVSRVHWVGADLGEDNQWLLRGGRMNVPFGLRGIEHTFWTREETHSDINASQQYGVALAYNKDKIRAEAMLIAGNFAVRPDAFRSRGYAAYFDYTLDPKLAVGVSSMILRAELDTTLITSTYRHSHGVFARWTPKQFVVLSSEVNLLHTSERAPGTTYVGAVGQVTADFEVTQGLHLGSTVEYASRSFVKSNSALGVWATAWWFFAPHADVRMDFILQNDRPSFLNPPSAPNRTLLLQGHFYL